MPPLFIAARITAERLGPKDPKIRNKVEGQNGISAWWETATGIQNGQEITSVYA
jgi:hypothetical protein